MPGSTGGPLTRGPNWRRKFRKSRAGRFAASAAPLPVFGTDQGAQNGWNVVNAAIGPLAGFRGYNGPVTGVPASWPGPDVGIIPASVPPAGQVISFKPNIAAVLAGTLDAALATYFASMPNGAFVTAWHEGELHAGVSQATLIAMHTHIYGVFGSSAPPACSYGQVISTASAFSGGAGYPVGPWMCTAANGGAQLDFYGMDLYPSSQTLSVSATVNTVIAALTAAGVPASGPWSFTEMAASSQYRGSQTQWWSDGWNVAQNIGALHFLIYFDNSPGVDAELNWPPATASTLRVLQDMAAIARGDPRSAAAATPARSTTAAMVSSSSSTGLTATFTSNPAAGSKVLVAVQAGFAATVTVSDNGVTPGVFVQDATSFDGTGGHPSVFVFRADNITLPASGTYAVSCTRAPTGSLQIAAAAYTGVENGPPTATSAMIGTTATAALDPVTPADLSSVFFSAFFCDSALNPEGITPASPVFALGATQLNGSTQFPGALADAIVTAPTPLTGGWTLADAPDWAAVMAAYSAFPATVSLVPGANAAWAQSPQPTPGVSVNAGLASASGWAAVNAQTGTVTARLAAATGTMPQAAVANAGLAAGTGTAQNAATAPFLAPVQVTPVVSQNVAGSGTVTLTFGSTVTPGNTVVVLFGSGQTTTNPTVSGITLGGSADHFASAKSLNNNADLNAEIWSDPGVSVSGATSVVVSYSGGTGATSAQSAVAYEIPGVMVADQVQGQAAGSGTTWDSLASGTTGYASEIFFGSVQCFPAPAVTGAGTWTTLAGTFAANSYWAGGYQAVSATGTAEFSGTRATGAGYSAVVTTFRASVGTNVTAGLAAGSGAALQAGGQNAGLASAAGSALQAGGQNAGLASGSGSALQAGGQNAGLAAASAAALPATMTNAPAGLAAGTGAAPSPGMGQAQPAAASGAALQAGGQNAGLASASAVALPAIMTNAPAGLAAGSGAALQAGGQNAGLAQASGAALPATAQTAGTTNAPAGLASASGAATAVYPGTNAGLAAATGAVPASSLAQGGLAAASGAAQAIYPGTDAGLAAGTGVALQPSGHTAGLASASGAAQAIYPGTNAGLASGSGAALAPAMAEGLSPASASGAAPGPAASVTVTAGLASGSGWAALNAPTGMVSAGLASASGAAPFTAGSTVSLTLTAVNPVGAAGAALPAGVGINAGLAAATGTALQAGGQNAGLASATGAALQAGGQNAGLASASGAALQPGGQNAGLAAATGAALAPAMAEGLSASPASGAALAPAAGVTVTAGLASASGSALQAGGQNAGLAAAAGAALAVYPGTDAGLAAGSGAALQAGGQNAGLAAGSGAALSPAVVTGITATPAAAAATGSALQAGGQNAGLAAGAGAALAVYPGTDAGLASGTGAALQAGGQNAGLASASGAALNAVTGINAGLASATGAALQSGGQNAGLAAATGAALAATVTSSSGTNATAGLAAAAGAALQAGGTNAGLATGAGAALAPAMAEGLAPALAAAGAQQPAAGVTVTAGLASASGSALQAGGQNAGLATASGAALPATVTASGTANAPAGLASATGTSLQAGGQNAGLASAAGAALAVYPGTNAGLATGAGAALQAGGQNAALATGSGAALQASVQTAGTTNAPAGLASASGVALPAGAQSAGTAAGTGLAQPPAATVTVTAGLAAAAGAAMQTAFTYAGLAAGTGAALQPSVTSFPSTSAVAGLASASGTAQAVTVSVTVTALLSVSRAAAGQPSVISVVGITGTVTWTARPCAPRWQARPAHPRWQAVPAHQRWRITVTAFEPVAAVSLEEINVHWTSELSGTVIDPTGQSAGSTLLVVQAAFPVSSGNPLAPAEPSTWYTGGWLLGGTSAGYIAQFLVGPGGLVTLTAGLQYDVWSQVEGTPEAPKKYAGTLSAY